MLARYPSRRTITVETAVVQQAGFGGCLEMIDGASGLSIVYGIMKDLLRAGLIVSRDDDPRALFRKCEH